MTTALEAPGRSAPEPEPPSGEPPLARRVGRGALWAAASNIVLRLGGVGVTAVVARLLAPEEFGVFAVSLAVFVVVASMAELGTASAVARAAEEPDDIAPTVATLSIGSGVVLALVTALGADAIAGLVGVPEAAGTIRILSLALLLTGLFAVPGAQLTREFGQGRIFVATVAGFVPANALLIALAATGGDATAFAWSRVVGQAVTGTVMVLMLSRHYRPGWNRALVGGLLRFGLPLSAANLVNWALLNADYVVIGRLLSPAEIGVYMIAFSVANWTTAVLGSVLNGVVMPAFGRVRHDAAQLADALVRATRLVALVALPIGVLTAVLAEPLVLTVFGTTWADAAPALTVLAAYGVLFSFSLLWVNVLISLGSTGRLLGIQLAWIAALVPAVVLGVELGGLVGVAWAHVVAIVAVAMPGYLAAVGRAGHPRWGRLVAAVRGPAGAAAAAGALAWLAARPLDEPWQRLLLGGVVGGAAYLLLAWPMLRGHLAEVTGRQPVAPDPGPDRLRVAIGLEGLALGGCPINALDLARTLRGRGHDVRVFAVDEDVRVSLLPYAAESGFEVTRLPVRRGTLDLARRIRGVVRAGDPDVVHVFAPWLAPPAAVATWGRRRTAVLMTNWTMTNSFWAGPRTPMVVGTGGLHEEAQRRHRGRVWLMEPTVDVARERVGAEAAAAFRSGLGIGPDEVVVSLVGRVDRAMKLEGIRHAIDAVVALDDPRLRLVVVGDGDAMAEVTARTEAANARLGRPAIVLAGSLVDPRPAYAAADVVLAMGGSAIRALAHGRTVVVLGENGFARLFRESSRDYFLDAGFFGQEPEPDPVGHLAGCLRDALGADREALGRLGSAFVEERFALEAATTALEGMYRDALRTRPALPVRGADAAVLLLRSWARDLRLRLGGRAVVRAEG